MYFCNHQKGMRAYILYSEPIYYEHQNCSFASTLPTTTFPTHVASVLYETLVFASTLPNQKFPKGILVRCTNSTLHERLVIASTLPNQKFPKGILVRCTNSTFRNNLLPNVCIFVSLETIVSQ